MFKYLGALNLKKLDDENQGQVVQNLIKLSAKVTLKFLS